MTFFLSLTAAIFYALQAVLLAKVARNYDSLLAQAIRGLSFGITMLPLLLVGLYFSDYVLDFKIIFSENLSLLLLAIFFTALANWCIATANTLLPVAYGSAFGTSLIAVNLSLIGFFYFKDNISSFQIVLTLALLYMILLFVRLKDHPKTSQTYKPFYGYLCAFAFSIFISIGFSLIAILSRKAHPFTVAYFWEVGIGIFLYALMLIRNNFIKKRTYKLSKDLFYKITLYSSPTILGTAAYSYALKLGPIPLVGAVHTSIIFFVAIYSSIIFKESLSRKHWLLIVLMFVILVFIKLS